MIDILLSTYNGETYLRPLLDSILGQRWRDFKLLIRDDGSRDSTVGILHEYARQDTRIVIIPGEGNNLGAFRSFMELAEASDAGYFAFADQDDVWLPGKLDALYKRTVEIERHWGANVPVVVFSDLTIADDALNIVDASLWRFQQFDPNICRNWRSLLAQNVVLGCAMMGNQSARNSSLPYLLPGMPHDQWVAVNAAKYGRIDFIRQSTILYRQHSDNYSGANRYGFRYALSRIPDFVNTVREYHNATAVFPGVSTIELILRKLILNLKRFLHREKF